MAGNEGIFRSGIANTASEGSANDIRANSYWLGGVDTRAAAMKNVDLARGGYGRLFIVKMPKFVEVTLPEPTQKFKHMLEFANIGIDGIAGYSVEFGSLTAGYSGTTVEMPTNVKDDTQSVTIKINETSKVLIQSYLDYWITGTIDPFTGLATYHGLIESDSKTYPYSQANHTMEAVYVHTDPTGTGVNYACLLTNMFPKGSDHSHWVTEPGSHELVSLSIEFTCNKYVTNQITAFGQTLLDNHNILKNYLNFNSGYSLSKSEKDGIVVTGADSEQVSMTDVSKIGAWKSGESLLTGAVPVTWNDNKATINSLKLGNTGDTPGTGTTQNA